MKVVKLSQGFVAVVDDEDYPLVSKLNWYYNQGYAKNKPGLSMHRLITGAKQGQIVDHRDGDGLNNTRSNLRLCTQAENARNRKMQSNNSSGYKGVYWDRSKKKWTAQISYDRRYHNLGSFDSVEEAAVAYNTVALDVYGEFARINVLQSA
jgi:hypothetical protein